MAVSVPSTDGPHKNKLLHTHTDAQAAFLTTVDPHASPRLRQRFSVTHLPTLLLFRDRKARQGCTSADP